MVLSKTNASIKLFCVSSPKQPAFQKTAPATDPGSPINLCHRSWLSSVSKT
ncbi:MAG: hypothetical protein ACPHY8_00295 [Patescibacteria group bacterium]